MGTTTSLLGVLSLGPWFKILMGEGDGQDFVSGILCGRRRTF